MMAELLCRRWLPNLDCYMGRKYLFSILNTVFFFFSQKDVHLLVSNTEFKNPHEFLTSFWTLNIGKNPPRDVSKKDSSSSYPQTSGRPAHGHSQVCLLWPLLANKGHGVNYKKDTTPSIPFANCFLNHILKLKYLS